MNISFAETLISVREGQGIVTFVLLKTEGAVGPVLVNISTQDGTAQSKLTYMLARMYTCGIAIPCSIQSINSYVYTSTAKF